jgi:hypothetical protein
MEGGAQPPGGYLAKRGAAHCSSTRHALGAELRCVQRQFVCTSESAQPRPPAPHKTPAVVCCACTCTHQPPAGRAAGVQQRGFFLMPAYPFTYPWVAIYGQ